MNNWFDVRGAAKVMGLSADTVYSLVENRRLGHRRVGVDKSRGRIHISDGHIAAFLESCEIPVRMEHARPPKEWQARPKPRKVALQTLRPDGKPMEFF